MKHGWNSNRLVEHSPIVYFSQREQPFLAPAALLTTQRLKNPFIPRLLESSLGAFYTFLSSYLRYYTFLLII